MGEAVASKGQTFVVSRACLVCRGTIARQLHHQEFVLPEGHPLGDSYDVVVCTSCGFAYADTQIRQADYDQFYARFSKYEDAETATGGGESPHDEARLQQMAFLIAQKLTDKNARILDIGCANGGLLQKLKLLGYERIAGVDPSAGCVANVKARGIEAFAGSLQRLPAETRGFECIALSHVLEHVQDVAGALEIVGDALLGDGLVYAEVPDATRYADFLSAPFQEFNTEHINHFSLASLKNAFLRAGFVCVEGGSRTIDLADGIRYPVTYGFFRKRDTPLMCEVEFDAGLEPSLRRYIDASAAQMAEIEHHLATSLQGLPGIVLWGMGQLAMKILRLKALREARIVACIDGNPINHGMLFRGIKVTGFGKVPGQQYPIVITTLLHHREIVRQIRARGIGNRIILLQPDPYLADSVLQEQ